MIELNEIILSAQIGGDSCHCENGGVCRKTEGGILYCDCPTDFKGNACQFSKGSNQIFYGIVNSLSENGLPILEYSLHRFLLFPLECKDDDETFKALGVTLIDSCSFLPLFGHPNWCAPDHDYGKLCKKSCETCGKLVLRSFFMFYPIFL